MTLIVVLGLAILHLEAGRLRFLGGTPRSIWLSMAGGIAVAYVFVHFLPELAAGQETVGEATRGVLPDVERHVYLVALAGLALFYGVERSARAASRAGSGGAAGRVFWLSIASFSLYNALIGYLLVHRFGRGGGEGLALFTVAMGLHFLVTDYGLREHHGARYRRLGRWILVGALLAGWVLGVSTRVSEALLAVLVAFLGGGVVLNVLKEELPEDRESRFWAFAVGAAGYAALLVATDAAA